MFVERKGRFNFDLVTSSKTADLNWLFTPFLTQGTDTLLKSN